MAKIGKLESIAGRGNRLETLRALRQKVAHTLDTTDSGRDVSSLSKQLRDITAEIEELENQKPENRPKTVLDIVTEKHGKANCMNA